MKKPIILLSLVFVVFLAGCTGTRVTSGTQGVVITSFSPDVTTTETSAPVTFTLVIENKGEWKATNVIAQLFGLSPDWNQQTVKFPKLSTSLDGTDVSAGIPGQIETDDVSVTPTASKATDTTYDANVRVAYTYATVSESLLRVAKTDYVKSITPPGGQPTQTFGIISSKYTGGPLTVNVKTRTTTIPPTTNTVTVTFEIQNVGGGRAFNVGGDIIGNPASVELDKIKWTVSSTGTTSVPTTCSSSGKLVGAKSKVITCTITLGTFTNFVEIPVKLQIEYGYFVDSSTSVTVLKTIGTVTPPPPSTTTPALVVSASPGSLNPTWSSIVTAQTSDNRAGVVISFSTTLGNFITTSPQYPNPCTTDSTGKCSVQLYSAVAGPATVTASSTGYTSGSVTVTYT